ncbi:RNA-directed DNA polymerase [Pseudanabaena sp. 'Roaring Creek']|uniref:RNA-directed DNA polymerase n=1 Tax=Pseudanabaena sp. 'Roaring Creek' TaxID=1681830 RepID=UPI0006D81DA8|nr:RNA-directed DNA polymerase [Pseudanabaena sp. 'Roaring Creek']
MDKSGTYQQMHENQRKQSLYLDLDNAFQPKQIVKVWKDTVRNGLRKQPLEDLHDFLDIHRNILPFADRLRKDVIDGRYKPSSPEFVHLEKRDGIPRRLAIPEPSDALALQCIVEVLESELKKAQPSQNAYYSRTHTPKDVEQVDGTFAYPWWVLWPQFQKRIWEFTNEYQYVVVTDIANYFDCIPLSALRNTLAACGKFSENLLNFLFYLLEAFSWRPYYMPHSGVGLPQINFDAPRLLAHVYLFKIDEELDKASNGDFVRWMDDIDVGVGSRAEGKKLLRNLDNVLSSQGLRLNTSKSKILSAQEAVEHFWIQENRDLTIIENSIKYGATSQDIQTAQKHLLRKKFRQFKQKTRTGQWDKVFKRYFGLFRLVKDNYLEKYLESILEETPSLRSGSFNYLMHLGISKKRIDLIKNFLLSGHCEDDVSLFEAIKCLINWDTPKAGKTVQEMVDIATSIAKKNGSYSSSGVIAAIWLLAKYGSYSDLISLINSSRSVWERSAWTARQIASVTPLLLEQDRLSIAEIFNQNKLLQALGVLAHIDSIRRLTNLDPQLHSYLKYQPSPTWSYYSLPKVILTITLLQGNLDSVKKITLRNKLLETIKDRRYKYLIANSYSC